jgi:hypothetical protein
MSIQAVAWVLERSASRLGARLVMISIANHADRHGATAFPSVKTIAMEAGMSPRQVYRLLPELIELGELEISEVGGRGRGTKHHYRIIGMANGDNMSPKADGLRVTFTAPKADPLRVTNPTVKGDILVAPIDNRPEPSSKQESSKTFPARRKCSRDADALDPMERTRSAGEEEEARDPTEGSVARGRATTRLAPQDRNQGGSRS